MFLNDFGFYLKEGLITEPEQETREEIAKLLRWESSALPPGETTSLDEYGSRLRAGARTIYFLSSPSRQLAEASPYLEAVRKRHPNTEVSPHSGVSVDREQIYRYAAITMTTTATTTTATITATSSKRQPHRTLRSTNRTIILPPPSYT